MTLKIMIFEIKLKQKLKSWNKTKILSISSEKVLLEIYIYMETSFIRLILKFHQNIITDT